MATVTRYTDDAIIIEEVKNGVVVSSVSSKREKPKQEVVESGLSPEITKKEKEKK